jgi:GntR family transcriptional regulator
MRKSDFSVFYNSIKLDSDKSDNLYIQLMRNIQNCIERGQLHDGEHIPSQRDIAVALNISRVTVGKAIEQLVIQGLLIKRQGAGTFVNSAGINIKKKLDVLNSFSDEMLARGINTHSHWLMKQKTLPTPEERLALDIAADHAIFRLTRIRFANELPLAYEIAAIPVDAVTSLHDIDTSLYNALQKRDNRPIKAKQRIKAVIPDREIRDYLTLTEYNATLYIERIALNSRNRAIEFTKSWYHSERYEFNTELTL